MLKRPISWYGREGDLGIICINPVGVCTEISFNYTGLFSLAFFLGDLLVVSQVTILPGITGRSMVNSLRPNDAYMRHQTSTSLVQIMACCLFGAKPLSKPMMYCQLGQTSITLYSKFKHFCSRKCFWNHRLENVQLSRPQCVKSTSLESVKESFARCQWRVLCDFSWISVIWFSSSNRIIPEVNTDKFFMGPFTNDYRKHHWYCGMDE